MAQPHPMRIAFLREMQRARWRCVSVALAFIVAAEGIYIHAFLAANYYALAAAYKIMQIAVGAAGASAIMWIAFILIRPWGKKPPSITSATDCRAYVASVIFTLSLAAILYGLLVDVSGFGRNALEAAIHEAAAGHAMSVMCIAGGAFAAAALALIALILE